MGICAHVNAGTGGIQKQMLDLLELEFWGSCELAEEETESQTQVPFKHYKLLSTEPATDVFLAAARA